MNPILPSCLGVFEKGFDLEGVVSECWGLFL